MFFKQKFILIVIITLIIIVNNSNAFVDLFICSNDTYSLLGYPAVLYYIYDGDLKLNSLSQQLIVRYDKKSIDYYWKALKDSVYYEFKNLSNGLTIDNLPLNGIVPMDEQSKFRLVFNCDNRDNLKDGYLHLLFTHDDTELYVDFNYKKYCKSDNAINQSNHSNFTIAYLSIAILASFFLIIGLIAFVLCIKKHYKTINLKFQYKILRKNPKNSHNNNNKNNNNNKVTIVREKGSTEVVKKVQSPTSSVHSSQQTFKNEQTSSSVYSKINRFNTNNNYKKYPTNQQNKIKQSNQNIYETLKDLTVVSNTYVATTNQSIVSCKSSATVAPVSSLRHVRSDQIKLEKILLEGTFSRIYEGILKNDKNVENDEDEEVRVIVKTVNDYASIKQTDLMISESSMFKDVKHKHINSLLAVCLEPDRHPLAIFSYCEYGNLKLYLRKVQQRSDTKNQILSTQELLYMILQLFKAINFLHIKRLLHKDIASRNCWVDKNLHIRLADSALSRDVFPNDYHCLGDNENRPIMWLAYESLCDKVYNVHTDIWSLGVTIWEILSFGAQPYEHNDPFDMEIYLKNDNNRLKKPHNCPNELFELFNKCWLIDSTKRPCLKDLFYAMLNFYSTLGNYV